MGYNLGAQILLNSNIDAVFASSDNIAIGIIKKFKEYNINIPRDISVIGYDNIQLSKFITPTLSTISQPIKSIAKEGVEMLVKLINNELSNPYIMLEPSIVIRESGVNSITWTHCILK